LAGMLGKLHVSCLMTQGHIRETTPPFKGLN